MKFISEKKWDFFFLLLLIFVSWGFGYHKILHFRPSSIHQWRQADCLSFAINYYQEGMHFFKPAVHWIGNQGDGRTVSEFPIIYYTVAFLWKIFGYHESIFRMVDLLIVFSGLFSLYKLCSGLLEDKAWALMIPLYLFSSPIFAYYGFNFLADVPALCLALNGWYFFFRFYQTEKNRYLSISMGFFLIGGLIKITSLLSFVPLILVFLIEALNLFPFKNGRKIFNNTKRYLIQFILVIAAIVSWYAYAIHYNKINNAGLFSTSILPIWKITAAQREVVLFRLYNELLPQFFNKAGFMFLTALLLGILISWKKINAFLFLITASVFVGVITYLILWYQVFTVHDYYLSNLLIIIPLVMITFFSLLKEEYPAIFKSVHVKVVFGVVLSISLYSCAMQMRVKYNILDRFELPKHTFMLEKSEKELWDWYHWDYNNHFKALETITPYNRSLGIKREDKVISIPDQSINISLVLMDQKGFSEFGYGELVGETRIRTFIGMGAKYLIINDEALLKAPDIQPFLVNKLGQYKNVSVYDLKGIEGIVPK